MAAHGHLPTLSLLEQQLMLLADYRHQQPITFVLQPFQIPHVVQMDIHGQRFTELLPKIEMLQTWLITKPGLEFQLAILQQL